MTRWAYLAGSRPKIPSREVPTYGHSALETAKVAHLENAQTSAMLRPIWSSRDHRTHQASNVRVRGVVRYSMQALHLPKNPRPNLRLEHVSFEVAPLIPRNLRFPALLPISSWIRSSYDSIWLCLAYRLTEWGRHGCTQNKTFAWLHS